MADAGDAEFGQPLARRHVPQRNDVDRQRDCLAKRLDQVLIAKTRRKEAVCAGFFEGLRALDGLVEQDVVMRIRFRLEEDVGSGVDERRYAGGLDGRCRSFDAFYLDRNVVQAGAADNLVFEIETDSAGP